MIITDLTKEIVLLVVVACNFFIGFFVLLKQPRSIINRAFFVTTTGAALWGLSLVLFIFIQDFVFSKFIFFGFLTMLSGLVVFTKVFPNTYTIRKHFWLLFIPLACIAAAVPFDTFIHGVVFHGNTPEPINGPLFPVFAIVSLIYVIITLYFLIRGYINSSGTSRLQMNYLVFGLSILVLSALIFNIILPGYGIFEFNLLGPISSIALIGTTAYAIIRHQLMDIRVVIQRSLIYTVVFSITLGLYIGLSITLPRMFTITANASAISSGIITLTIGFLGMARLEGFFKKVTDRWFFKDEYNYSNALHTLSDILNTNVQFNSIVYESIIALRKILKVTHVEYYVFEDSTCFSEQGKSKLDVTFPQSYFSERVKNTKILIVSELDEMINNPDTSEQWREIFTFVQKEATARDIAVTVPVVLDTKLISIIGIGDKRSGDAFTNEDIILLKTFANQAAVALEKARLYTKVELHAKELEQKVKERTYEIQELQKSQEQVIIDISHNLQTPLTILKGELEKLQRNNVLDKETFEKLEQSISRVSNFIYRLLQLSKAGTDKKHERFNLSKLISNAVEYFTTVAEDQNVTLTSTVEDDVHMIGDPQHIEEVLTNLVSNAIKYRKPDEQATINITLATDSIDQNIMMSVEDNGKGIAQDDLENIFTRFYRACNSGSLDDLEGTGLGLAISKKIIEKYQGKILVESTPDTGSTFTVVLPLEDTSQK